MKRTIINNWLFRIETDDKNKTVLDAIDYIITILIKIGFLCMGVTTLRTGNILGFLFFIPLIIVNLSFETVKEWKLEDAPLMKLYRKLRGL